MHFLLLFFIVAVGVKSETQNIQIKIKGCQEERDDQVSNLNNFDPLLVNDWESNFEINEGRQPTNLRRAIYDNGIRLTNNPSPKATKSDEMARDEEEQKNFEKYLNSLPKGSPFLNSYSSDFKNHKRSPQTLTTEGGSTWTIKEELQQTPEVPFIPDFELNF